MSTDVVSAPPLLVPPGRIDPTLETSLRAIVTIVPPLLATSVGVLLRDAGYQVLNVPPGALAGAAGAGGFGLLAAAGSLPAPAGPGDFDIAVFSAILPGPGNRPGFVVLPLHGLLQRWKVATPARPRPGEPAPPQAVVVSSVHDLLRTLDQLRRSVARRAGPLQPL